MYGPTRGSVGTGRSHKDGSVSLSLHFVPSEPSKCSVEHHPWKQRRGGRFEGIRRVPLVSSRSGIICRLVQDTMDDKVGHLKQTIVFIRESEFLRDNFT